MLDFFMKQLDDSSLFNQGAPLGLVNAGLALGYGYDGADSTEKDDVPTDAQGDHSNLSLVQKTNSEIADSQEATGDDSTDGGGDTSEVQTSQEDREIPDPAKPEAPETDQLNAEIHENLKSPEEILEHDGADEASERNSEEDEGEAEPADSHDETDDQVEESGEETDTQNSEGDNVESTGTLGPSDVETDQEPGDISDDQTSDSEETAPPETADGSHDSEAATPRPDNTLYKVSSDSTTKQQMQSWLDEMSEVSVIKEGIPIMARAKEIGETNVDDLFGDRDKMDVLSELAQLGHEVQLYMKRVEDLSEVQKSETRITRAEMWMVIKSAYQKAHGRSGNFNKWYSECQSAQSWRGLHNDIRVAQAKDAGQYGEFGMRRLLNIVMAIRKDDVSRMKTDNPIRDFLESHEVRPQSIRSNSRLSTLKRDVDVAVNCQALWNVGITSLEKPKVKVFTTKHGLLKNVHLNHLKRQQDSPDQLEESFQALIDSTNGTPNRVQRRPAQINGGRFTEFEEAVKSVVNDADKRDGLTPEMVQGVIDQLSELKQILNSTDND